MTSTIRDVLWTGFDGQDVGHLAPGPLPGGLVLFAKNLEPDPASGPPRCHALVRALRREGPRVLALDQEGGAVSRLRAWVGPTPSLRDIWLRQGAAGCARWGTLWGRGLALLGIQVDFAPVADLWDGFACTGFDSRAASGEPLEAAKAAGAFLWGLEGKGVRGCLKHFPGLGGTRVDSHRALPALNDSPQLARNLFPFRALAHPDRLVMVAHLETPGTGGLPASLHRASVAGNPHGIRARWIPDALEMGGCALLSWPDRVRLALEAGHEALLVCQPAGEVAACTEALSNLPRALWGPAAARFDALRRQLDTPLPDWEPAAWAAWVGAVRRAAEGLESARELPDPTEA
jgi:beta-N-acetylhexosaminidase